MFPDKGFVQYHETSVSKTGFPFDATFVNKTMEFFQTGSHCCTISKTGIGEPLCCSVTRILSYKTTDYRNTNRDTVQNETKNNHFAIYM